MREREGGLRQQVKQGAALQLALLDLQRVVAEAEAVARLQLLGVEDALTCCADVYKGLKEQGDVNGQDGRAVREEEHARVQEELERGRARACDAEAALERFRAEAETQVAGMRKERDDTLHKAAQQQEALEHAQGAWQNAAAEVAELRWLLQQRDTSLGEAEVTCREAEAALDDLQRRNEEISAGQQEHARSLAEARLRVEIARGAAQVRVGLTAFVMFGAKLRGEKRRKKEVS